METIITLLVWALCGFWCYKIADKNGRNSTLAAVLGVLFGLFAVAGYAIAGKKTSTDESTNAA